MKKRDPVPSGDEDAGGGNVDYGRPISGDRGRLVVVTPGLTRDRASFRDAIEQERIAGSAPT
jgi:hypothetical protein